MISTFYEHDLILYFPTRFCALNTKLLLLSKVSTFEGEICVSLKLNFTLFNPRMIILIDVYVV